MQKILGKYFCYTFCIWRLNRISVRVCNVKKKKSELIAVVDLSGKLSLLSQNKYEVSICLYFFIFLYCCYFR